MKTQNLLTLAFLMTLAACSPGSSDGGGGGTAPGTTSSPSPSSPASPSQDLAQAKEADQSFDLGNGTQAFVFKNYPDTLWIYTRKVLLSLRNPADLKSSASADRQILADHICGEAQAIVDAKGTKDEEKSQGLQNLNQAFGRIVIEAEIEQMKPDDILTLLNMKAEHAFKTVQFLPYSMTTTAYLPRSLLAMAIDEPEYYKFPSQKLMDNLFEKMGSKGMDPTILGYCDIVNPQNEVRIKFHLPTGQDMFADGTVSADLIR